ncbi:MAG: GNAT family N-acetyltransferase [Ignavibacteriales bacterium]|nr:GNAT family N-acetyltransferase [Ignavibacteriales bacterium]
MEIRPVVLQGKQVRLEPLTLDHVNALCSVAFDEDLWRIGLTTLRTKEDVVRYVENALDLQQKGTALPFATLPLSTNKAVGSTRFGNIDIANRRVEIGWTWLGKQWQRTGLNTEAKFLMLRHAFEVWKCIRVEFKTDVLNEQSRRAIVRLGAKEEGILRKHAISSGGRIRDSVYYSILDDEWTDIKQHFTTHLLRT